MGGPEATPSADLRPALEQALGRASCRQEFAAEALRTVVDTLSVSSAAIFQYDAKKDRLRLLHTVGLGPETERLLGEPALWSIPRHAIRNCRISVIDAAHRNPFVPKPIVALSPKRLSIAVVPFAKSGHSVGGVVLFSGLRGAFPDPLLRSVEQGLQVCSTGFVELADTANDGGAASYNGSRLKQVRSSGELLGETIAKLELAEELERARVERDAALADVRRSHEDADAELRQLRDELAEAQRRSQELLSTLKERAAKSVRRAEHVRNELEAELMDIAGGASETAPEHAAIDRTEDPGEAASGERAPALALLDFTASAQAIARHLQAAGSRVCVLDGASGGIAMGPRLATALNLAIPSAWRTTAELRAERRIDAPLGGYLLPGEAQAGYWLGAVDLALLSTEDGTLIDTLRQLRPSLRRVISLSASEATWPLWTEMKAAGISTWVVFDGAQALSLLPSVRPEAAVLHLSPETTDVFHAIQGFRETSSYRDIPLLFLLDAVPGPGEEAFLESGISSLLGRSTVSAAAIAEALLASLRLRG